MNELQMPRDRDAKALVAAILENLDVEAMPQAETMDALAADVGTRMGIARGLAERLKVVLDAQDAAAGDMLAALDHAHAAFGGIMDTGVNTFAFELAMVGYGETENAAAAARGGA